MKRCLSDIMNVHLNDDSPNKPSQEEREVAEHLAEIIISICNRKRFDYEEETTFDVYYQNSSKEYDDGEEENELKKEHHELSNFSLEFMKRVVDYAYEEDESGQRCRT